jgi:hypothetical protein
VRYSNGAIVHSIAIYSIIHILLIPQNQDVALIVDVSSTLIGRIANSAKVVYNP